MLEGVGSLLAVAIFLIWWRLGSMLTELKGLNYKTEFWGKGIDQSLREIQTRLDAVDAEVSSATSELKGIAARAREHFPTEREANRDVAP